MYTGTLIQDLLKTVEQAERVAEQRQICEVRELQRLFEMQVPQAMTEALAGAA